MKEEIERIEVKSKSWLGKLINVRTSVLWQE